MIQQLQTILSRKDKQYLFFLFIFSIFISLLETIGVGIIMPFISVATDFEKVNTNQYFNYVYELFAFSDPISFVLYFGFFLIFFYLFRSGINLLYFYTMAKFSKGRYHIFAYRLFENYLGRSYKDFVLENSSNLNKTIINEAQNLTQIFSSLLLMISEIFVMIFIYSFMLYINWKMTLLLTLLLLINGVLLMLTVTKKMKIIGIDREKFQKKFYEILNSAFGNFKMVKLKSNDQKILEEFGTASEKFAKTNIINNTLLHFPRLFLEAIGFITLVIIVLYIVNKYQNDISSFLALISMFILGLYRLVPSINRVLSSYNEVVFFYKSLDIIHNDLIYEIEDLGNEEVEFNEKIVIDNISFLYEEKKTVLKNITMEIKKNSKIAFVGESGSGKSTFVDLLMGLYRPVTGKIYIDEQILNEENIKSWRKKIGYIPQHIYLFDGTVAQNVAFMDRIDEDRVKKVLKQANIYDFLEEHHLGIDTQVGENGLKLSGGQKQRIAIARALYNDPEVLVLDEATSALDTQTEAKIMDEIYQACENKTLLIIAHRLSTIQNCDYVFELNNGIINKGKVSE